MGSQLLYSAIFRGAHISRIGLTADQISAADVALKHCGRESAADNRHRCRLFSSFFCIAHAKYYYTCSSVSLLSHIACVNLSMMISTENITSTLWIGEGYNPSLKQKSHQFISSDSKQL